jgi:hypothetical protein
MRKRTVKRATGWEAPANADLLKRGAASSDAAPRHDDSRFRVFRRSWWRRLVRQLIALVALAVVAFGVATYQTGGIGPMASLLLRKETHNNLPASAWVRRAAVEVVARRAPTPDVLMQLARLAHVLEPDDPLWRPVIEAAGRQLGQSVPIAGDPTATLAALDTAIAKAVGQPLEGLGVLGWQPISEYFVQSIDELASEDAAVGAHRFNSLRTPDGLPTSEWYVDELVLAFGDPRPVAFVLVADSTGDEWTPMAFPPDQVPAHARRIRVTTVGEALRVGLWGLEAYRPATPDEDVVAWWTSIARARALPTFAPPS